MHIIINAIMKKLLTQVSNGEPILFATVALYKSDKLIQVIESDLDGYYLFKNFDPGNYSVEASFLGMETTSAKITARAGKQNFLNMEMEEVAIDLVVWGCFIHFEEVAEIDSFSFLRLEEPTPEIEENELIVYPNPTADVLKIKSNNNYERVILVDMNGDIILDLSSNEDFVEIPVHNFSEGLYNVVLQKSDGQLFSRKVMITPN